MGNTDTRKTVLCADGDENIRNQVKSLLNKAGYDVLPAADGREAMKIYENNRPDLVVLGIRMPYLDGIDVITLLAHGTGKTDVPVVIYSEYSHYKENFATWAAEAYIMKGANSGEELLQVVDDLLKRRG